MVARLRRNPHGLEGRYNRHDYFNERREALATWTALLVKFDAGRARVVPIHARRKREVRLGGMR
jgi:hypothetical protein